MDWSVILNIVFGAGLVTTIVGLLSVRSELKKARADAEKAMAEADTVKITNTEQATRILIQNIVEPLREELDATRKELNPLKREVTRLRKAVEAIQYCPYRSECPVRDELRDEEDGDSPGADGQSQGHGIGIGRANKRRGARQAGHGGRAANQPGADRQSASGSGVQRADGPGKGGTEKAQQWGRDFERSGHQPGEGGNDLKGGI